MDKVTVRVPATSANLGPAFDCAGLALTMYNSVAFEQSESLDIQTLDGTSVPLGEGNMVYAAAMQLCDELGKPRVALRLRQRNDIPMVHGLGSSAACIVAGLCGMNQLLGGPLSQKELLEIGVAMDGHPDNVAPAMLGGVVIAAMGESGLSYSRFELKDDLCFAAMIPPFELETALARKALPAEVPLKDAVFNLSRSAVLAAAFATGDYALLREACRDRLHQPYRIGLIAGGQQAMDAALECGAYASFISGAGSSLLAVSSAADAGFFERLGAALKQDPRTAAFRLVRLMGDNAGVQIQT